LNPRELRRKLESLAEARFMRVFGVADLAIAASADASPSGLPEAAGLTRACVFGMSLQTALIETLVDQPTPLYFHHYRQVNYQLDSTALEAAAIIQAAGYRAVAVAASQVIAQDPMRGHVSHRVLGWAAGLGWRGRNNLLVNPRFGSRFRLVSVLTDAPLECGKPLTRDCGVCRACIGVCPAQAIRESPGDFRLDLCYAKLCEFARIPFVGQHICGVCVKACRPPRTHGE
jgi:epoxyqueuosine reductase QueG